MEKLKILPENKFRSFKSATSLKDLLSRSQVTIVYPCGGAATCGKCRVHFIEGAPQPSYADSVYFTESELQKGYRLACTCTLSASATIKIPETSRVERISVLSESKTRRLTLDPFVSKHRILKKAADIKNLHSDEEIILQNFKKSVRIDNRILHKLPAVLRDQTKHVTATKAGDNIIDLEPGDTSGHVYGCAVDLGTTTIVVGMYDLSNGQTIAVKSALNPQVEFGEDLISRIAFIGHHENRVSQLQKMVVDCINGLVKKICRQLHILPERIYEFVIAGNAAQNHIVSGVNPYSLSVAPYTPVFKALHKLQARDIGIKVYPYAPVWILPNMGGFVGGDICADMLTAGFFRRRRGTHLLLDIGTNSEVVLHHNSELMAASSPAGPALEGACISCGMRAETGAIYDIIVHDENIETKTIDDKPARGICGSGLFHIISEALRQGWIKTDGRMSKEVILKEDASTSAYISLTQSDVREFQLAKAAIAAAWKTLCSDMPVDIDTIEKVYIAGAFGNFIRPDTALQIGLVPPVDLSRIHFIGNASLAGARIALLNKQYLYLSRKMTGKTRFVELAGRPDFQDRYVENLKLVSEDIKK